MRWLMAGLSLSVVFFLLDHGARTLVPLQALSNLAGLLTVPASVVAHQFFPPISHDHSPPGFFVARAVIAGFGYVMAFYAVGALFRSQTGRLDPSRRRLLAAGLAAPAAGLAVYASAVEPGSLEVRRYEVKLSGLPPALEGLKIGHLSDTHHGPLVSLGFIRSAIERLNSEGPDIVFLTGDFVHQTQLAIPDGIGVLTECRARFGSLSVLGNHDHWESEQLCRQEFGRRGLRLIDSDRVFLSADGLSDDPVKDSVAICGVGDLWEGKLEPEAALRGVPEDCPRLLLSHNPDVAELIPLRHPGLRFDLQFSGHTHGGQVLLPGVGPLATGSAYGKRYLGGLLAGPAWPVVVSRGVGMTVFPVRFRVPPEIGLVTLRAA